MSSIKEIVYIKDTLIELNFNISSIGFKYWIHLIYEYCIKDRRDYLGTIYKDIASAYNTSSHNVERSLRTAMKTAIPTIRKHYNFKKKKLSIKDFLNLIYWCMKIKNYMSEE